MIASRNLPAGAQCNVFFHMPKTAGQTLINLISREYKDHVLDTQCAPLERSNWDEFTRRLAEMPEERLRATRALTGRMKFGVHELLPGPSQYITFARDPVKRFISFYRMTKRLGMISPDHTFDLGRPDWNCPRQGWFTREIDNGQVRALADADWDLPLGAVTEAHYEAAMANLKKYFVFVGLTEKFDLSLVMLGRLCGWRPHLYVARNVAPRLGGQPPVSPEVRAAIAGMNTFDRRLYRYACARFQEQVAAGGLALRARFRLFRMANSVHGGIHRLVHPGKERRRRLRQEDLPELQATVPPLDHAPSAE